MGDSKLPGPWALRSLAAWGGRGIGGRRGRTPRLLSGVPVRGSGIGGSGFPSALRSPAVPDPSARPALPCGWTPWVPVRPRSCRRIGPGVLLVASLLLAAGCSGDPGMVTTEGRDVLMPDGRTVPCVVAVEGTGGSTGVSCDWAAAHR
ncbi:hypothetical protein BJY24_007836 [Nocardia transvalensis]|uniref:Uncharacterized protein n=1 Tax=Nocardia transvalensis TaxID=37333 RepID=A0A7W9PMJ9_9NOCA|nr:hypothetical protein [Nocardia transvalensis]MBB5918924.1 hypothetical protein [Nocardia transvalensis]